jgi:hypothetical protein
MESIDYKNDQSVMQAPATGFNRILTDGFKQDIERDDSEANNIFHGK